jgi:hypothetical protein
MDSIFKVLKNKSPEEPPQVAALKKYVRDNHKRDIQVSVSKSHYLITVPGAALAHTLRIETAKIIEICDLDKRLVIHIGYK